jgi:hypothetical protein
MYSILALRNEEPEHWVRILGSYGYISHTLGSHDWPHEPDLGITTCALAPVYEARLWNPHTCIGPKIRSQTLGSPNVYWPHIWSQPLGSPSVHWPQNMNPAYGGHQTCTCPIYRLIFISPYVYWPPIFWPHIQYCTVLLYCTVYGEHDSGRQVMQVL